MVETAAASAVVFMKAKEANRTKARNTGYFWQELISVVAVCAGASELKLQHGMAIELLSDGKRL